MDDVDNADETLNLEGFDPDEYIGFWLFYAERSSFYVFSEMLKERCQQAGKSYVVTPPQWGVLSLLYAQDGLTIGSISQTRQLDAATMTGIVRRLEANGLAERRHDSVDRRVVRVFISDEGRQVVPQLARAALAFNRMLTRGLSASQQKEVLQTLKRLNANVSQSAAAATQIVTQPDEIE